MASRKVTVIDPFHLQRSPDIKAAEWITNFPLLFQSEIKKWAQHKKLSALLSQNMSVCMTPRLPSSPHPLAPAVITRKILNKMNKTPSEVILHEDWSTSLFQMWSHQYEQIAQISYIKFEICIYSCQNCHPFYNGSRAELFYNNIGPVSHFQ